MQIVVTVAPAVINAEVVLPSRLEQLPVIQHHIGPDCIYVRGMGKIHHIRSIAPGRSHIHFQPHEITDLAQARFRLGEPEELEMYEAAAHIESLYRCPSQLFQCSRHILEHIVAQIQLLINHIHHGRRELCRRLKDRFAIRVDYGIVGIYVPENEFLHHIRHIDFCVEEVP